MTELSELDESRFGIRTAKAAVGDTRAAGEALAFCREHSVRLLIIRTPAERLEVAQLLESRGGWLMDVLVYYSLALQPAEIPAAATAFKIRGVSDGDHIGVGRVATESFRGYRGHYHADPRIASATADEVYVSWALRSCEDRAVAGEVLIAEDNENIVGFATLRMNSSEEGEGVLFGVSPAAQGRGLYRTFMLEGMRWCAEQGAQQMVVSTQVTNIAVQKVWTRLGFEPNRSYLTFHSWFD
jgi:GNAT superfamily N-acetyltransferase